jgi:hypothetical protein
MKPIKYARAFADNAPDYFVVSTGEWRAPVIATCDTEANAARIVQCVNAHDELIKALAQIDANCAESPEWIRRVARAALAQVQS